MHRRHHLPMATTLHSLEHLIDWILLPAYCMGPSTTIYQSEDTSQSQSKRSEIGCNPNLVLYGISIQDYNAAQLEGWTDLLLNYANDPDIYKRQRHSTRVQMSICMLYFKYRQLILSFYVLYFTNLFDNSIAKIADIGITVKLSLTV